MLEQSRTYTSVNNQLELLAQGFIETGVAVVEGVDFSGIQKDNWKAKSKKYRQERMPLTSITMKRSFIRQVAKDLRRPIVIVEKDGWDGAGLRASFKKTNRFAPIIAHYVMLLGQEVIAKWDHHKPRAPVEVSHDKTNWYVNFNGKKGAKEFDVWLLHLKTDPACRAALKL